MSVPAVRVLPSSRPEPRTWSSPTSRPEPATSPRTPETPTAPGEVPGPRRRPGHVERVGGAWGAPVPVELPESARWSGWFAIALGEALLGRRPATQLAGWVTPEVLAGLNRRQRLRPAEQAAPRTVLLSGRVQHPGPRSAEASAVLRAGARLLVLAFRLEARDGRWLCTALEAGLTPQRTERADRPRRPAAPSVSSAGTAAG